MQHRNQHRLCLQVCRQTPDNPNNPNKASHHRGRRWHSGVPFFGFVLRIFQFWKQRPLHFYSFRIYLFLTAQMRRLNLSPLSDAPE